jgi:hypothetical protein
VSELRVLVASAAPRDLAPLDLIGEWREIWRAVRDEPVIKVEPIDRPTLGTLHDELVARRSHVLHFMGHGSFAQESGEGCLFFEDAARHSQAVGSEALGAVLGSLKDLRLVVLNACGTGAVARRGGLDPYSGMAAALVLAGVPAVVAMQFPISDEAAITFGAKLYERLAAGDPIEAAVADGRLAMALAKGGSLEWATPVLFVRDAGSEPIVPEGLSATHEIDISGRYSVTGGEAGEAGEAVMERLSDDRLMDRYRFARGNSLVGAGFCWSRIFLGVYRDTASTTWGIMRGTLFGSGGFAMQTARVDGTTTQRKEAWKWEGRVPERPATVGVRRNYTMNRDPNSPLGITPLGDDVVAVEALNWRGVGLLREGRYLGIFRYTAGDQWLGVWGCHEGTERADGVLMIRGRNLIAIGGEFEIAWVPAAGAGRLEDPPPENC